MEVTALLESEDHPPLLWPSGVDEVYLPMEWPAQVINLHNLCSGSQGGVPEQSSNSWSVCGQ